MIHSLSIRHSAYFRLRLRSSALVTRHRYWLMTLNMVRYTECGLACSSQRWRAGTARTDHSRRAVIGDRRGYLRRGAIPVSSGILVLMNITYAASAYPFGRLAKPAIRGFKRW